MKYPMSEMKSDQERDRTGGFLTTHGFADVSVYVCAVGAGASALAGFIMKEKAKP